MGQLATTIAGGVAGFLIGGPMGAQVGMMLGGMVGQSLFGPTVKGPRLNDLKVSASTYGVAIPEIYGTVRVGGNMVWTTGIREVEKTERAGKGGPKQTTYSYDASFALAICKGPIDDILRIWADGKLLFDKSRNSTRTPYSEMDAEDRAKFLLTLAFGKDKKKRHKFRVYRGTEEQMPDSLIEAHKGVGNVSAFRGIAYMVFENMELEDFGNRIPQFTFEVSRNLTRSFGSVEVLESDNNPLPQVTSRAWFPDWELGRLLSVENGLSATRSDIIDIASMKSVYHIDEAIHLGDRLRYVPGTGQLYTETGATNSRPMNIWDGFTLTRVGAIGEASNSLSGFYLNNCGEIYGPNGGSYGALGQMGYGYAANGTRHNIFIGWSRTTWAFANPSTKPIFNTQASFTPTFMFPGRTSLSASETIGWRNANSRLELEIWRIGGDADSKLKDIPPPSGCSGPSYAWEPSNDFSQVFTALTPVEGQNYIAKVVLFDPTDNCIFTMGTTDGVPFVGKWSVETATWKFARNHAGLPLPMNQMNYSRLDGGTFGYGFAKYREVGKLIEINLQNGDIERDIAFGDAYGDQLYFGQNQQWDDVSKSLIVETQGAFRRISFAANVTNLTIASVVSDICEQTNVLGPGDYDVSGLNPDELTGYLIDRETSARDVLRQLATGFMFDGYESDYLLKFRSRGDSPQVTITEEWLGRDSNMEVIKDTIAQELEMPKRITVNYYDVTRDHQQGTQSAKRISGPLPSMLSSKEDIIDLPITWTPDRAKQAADKLLKMAWANRSSVQVELPWRFLKYDPTDVATIVLDSGTTYTVRLNESLIGADFTVQVKAQSEKATAYVSDAVGANGEAPLQVIGLDYPSFPFVINTPLLRDLDYDANETALCYVSVGSNALQFNGADVFMSDGFEFTNLGTINSRAVSGYAQSILPPTRSYGSTDEKTKLIVRLTDASRTLESVTQEEMLNNNVNAALVGEEIIQFREATLLADGAWELSGLLRARRGTNYAVNNHVAGERFVMLDPTTTIGFRRPPENYTTNRDFKAVPPNTLVEDALSFNHTLTPRDLMPFTPEDIKITDDDTTVSVTMQRRSRVIAPLKDGTGLIHYKEGDKPSAKITYKLWAGLTLADVATVAEPTLEGSVSLFDAAGADIDPEFNFALTALNGETTALLRLTEMGAVEGIPKFLALERIGTGLWNIDEFY